MVIVCISFFWFFLIFLIVYKKQVDEIYFVAVRSIVIILLLTMNKYIKISYFENINEYFISGVFTLLEISTAIIIGKYIKRKLVNT